MTVAAVQLDHEVRIEGSSAARSTRPPSPRPRPASPPTSPGRSTATRRARRTAGPRTGTSPGTSQAGAARQHRLLRLQVLHPGRRLRRRGPRGRAASPEGHPEPARADPAGRRRAGRNGSGDRVDIAWTPNPECDVIGYRVYRSSARARSGPRSAAPARPAGPDVTTKDWCVDETAPATGPLYYTVVGVDTLAYGALREGSRSPQASVPATGGNSADGAHEHHQLHRRRAGLFRPRRPDAPTARSWSAGIRPRTATAPSPSTASTATAPRTPTGGMTSSRAIGRLLAWLEYSPGPGRTPTGVSAVDNKFGESGLSASVTAP